MLSTPILATLLPVLVTLLSFAVVIMVIWAVLDHKSFVQFLLRISGVKHE
jgi:hypothetical protein